MNKTVYLGMIADIMHPGLINIINEGAKYGDVIIGLFTDKAIAQHKRLPYLTYEQRKNVVENIRNVNQVVPQDDWSYAPNLRRLKPDYIIHGDDWQTGPDRELREEAFEVMKELGGEVIEIPYTKGIESSSLDKEIKGIGTTPDIRLKTLRRLIDAKPVVRTVGAYLREPRGEERPLHGHLRRHVELVAHRLNVEGKARHRGRRPHHTYAGPDEHPGVHHKAHHLRR